MAGSDHSHILVEFRIVEIVKADSSCDGGEVTLGNLALIVGKLGVRVEQVLMVGCVVLVDPEAFVAGRCRCHPIVACELPLLVAWV